MSLLAMFALARFQTLVALTRAELRALATLVGLAALGLGAQAVQRAEAAPPAPPAEAAAFARRSALPATAVAPAAAEVKAQARTGVAAEAPVSAQDVAHLLPPVVAAPPGAAESAPASTAEAAVSERAAHRSQRKPPFTGRINLNTATSAQLQQLPRIGEAMAERILEHRRRIGRFRSVDQLDAVRGIGEKTLEKLRPHLYV